ncbi:hypothetical protein AB0I60_27155 [Actinosynnema sp. NPDC050436]|uniref:hypothetical protein n=1 Tax=Actinosynnema sp. NPDC050436 TaxID=3155659 RepID=UPI0033C5951B
MVSHILDLQSSVPDPGIGGPAPAAAGGFDGSPCSTPSLIECCNISVLSLIQCG